MYLIGIAGGSGSGKTTFAKKVVERAGGAAGVGILHQDSYYLPSPPEHLRIDGGWNFDHPEAFDWKLMRDHLARLKFGEPVAIPEYDFANNRRSDRVHPLGPVKVLIVEGILALWDARIRELCDIKVYLSVDADIRFIRRLHRDVRERGRTLDSIIKQYYDTVRPMHREYLEATRQFADMVVGEETDIAAEVLAARVRQLLPEGRRQGEAASSEARVGVEGRKKVLVE